MPCCKLTWLCHKHSNDGALRFGTEGQSTTFVARHNVHVALEVALLQDCQNTYMFQKMQFQF